MAVAISASHDEAPRRLVARILSCSPTRTAILPQTTYGSRQLEVLHSASSSPNPTFGNRPCSRRPRISIQAGNPSGGALSEFLAQESGLLEALARIFSCSPTRTLISPQTTGLDISSWMSVLAHLLIRMPSRFAKQVVAALNQSLALDLLLNRYKSINPSAMRPPFLTPPPPLISPCSCIKSPDSDLPLSPIVSGHSSSIFRY